MTTREQIKHSLEALNEQEQIMKAVEEKNSADKSKKEKQTESHSDKRIDRYREALLNPTLK